VQRLLGVGPDGGACGRAAGDRRTVARMGEWPAAEYGDAWAAVYDERHGDLPDTGDAVETLARLAGAGPVLELGIGTGRLALPLAARGLEVHGIDASAPMVDRLRAKPRGDSIPVTIGDMASLTLDRTFSLVFVAFNTLFNLPSQEAQVRCIAGAAAHLAPGGRFVVEAFVPDLGRFDRGQAVRATDVTEAHVVLEIARHDPVVQRVHSARVVVTPTDGIRMLPVNIRYAWPAEVDLMARLAGLEHEERWSGWQRQPFDESSRQHVSVYRRPAGDGHAAQPGVRAGRSRRPVPPIATEGL
jgi:SAM-dependent methyltransferase